MKPASAIATDFDPTSIATAGIGHNQPPEEPAPTPFDLIKQEIEDLFEEAKHWCDGEAIRDQATHYAIEKLYDGIHEAGKRAEALRKAEKDPLDEQVKAIQAKYNPLTQKDRGKVDLTKSELSKLLTPWRDRIRIAKEQEAARVAAAALAAKAAADEAIRASSGNLAAREEAEELLADAKKLERSASRTWKAATTGTGLRTVWTAVLEDEDAAMEWCWARAKAEVLAVAQQNADAAVRAGARAVPGFRVEESKRAA
jgi:hypothetical protein